MDRITNANLEHLVSLINKATNSPAEPWHNDGSGKLTANIGCYHLDYAYGGVSLERISNDGGGVKSIFYCGHIPKRDLYNRMRAFLEGIDAAKAIA